MESSAFSKLKRVPSGARSSLADRPAPIEGS